MPRVALQGNYDDTWRKTRYPLLPKDFDARFFQCAAPDLIATPHLLGDETVTLISLLPERRDMRLPEWKVLVAATLASGKVTIMPLSLETLRFDLQTQQASLVWRTHFRYDDFEEEGDWPDKVKHP